MEKLMLLKVKALTVKGTKIGRIYYKHGRCFLEQDPKSYEVLDPNTICRSTGKIDFCGEDIYEGDILILDQNEGEVRWHQRDARWVVVFGSEVIPLSIVKHTAFVLRNKWESTEHC